MGENLWRTGGSPFSLREVLYLIPIMLLMNLVKLMNPVLLNPVLLNPVLPGAINECEIVESEETGGKGIQRDK